MKKQFFATLTILFVSFLAISQTACSRDSQAKTATNSTYVHEIQTIYRAGENEPVNFTWKENGKEMNLIDEVKGKVTFLNFWGTWCPPCRAEIPYFVDLLSTYSSSGFQVIGIALERDPNKANELVSNFVEKQKMNYRNFPSREYAEEFAKVYGNIQYVPTTFVIGKDGKIVEKIVGGRTKQDFEDVIKKYMNQ